MVPFYFKRLIEKDYLPCLIYDRLLVLPRKEMWNNNVDY